MFFNVVHILTTMFIRPIHNRDDRIFFFFFFFDFFQTLVIYAYMDTNGKILESCCYDMYLWWNAPL